MGMEFLLFIVVLLLCIAVFDLIVGVSNDAVNFLNSSIGSKAAPRYIIMIVASLGILAGVTFSSGMMEIARKGIFHPQMFTMPELLTIFLAVMLADVIVLDLFNTYGLPTSTTVSLVFELLGAAVALAAIKAVNAGNDIFGLGEYINSSKAMIIILGILMSVAIAFVCGACAQFFSRLLFTFNYKKRLRRYGAIWGGIALMSITYFILKGAKGAFFITPAMLAWIDSHTYPILLVIFLTSAILLYILALLGINILKLIVIVGTFALAMSFAANDLVNFIGVPLAGLHAYTVASMSDSALTITMTALRDKVQPQNFLLLLAGIIMVLTLWFSRKARTVTDTEVNLSSQEEGWERFESFWLARAIVRMWMHIFSMVTRIIPNCMKNWVSKRINPDEYRVETTKEGQPSFDLIRASVNLMMSAAIISYATSRQLPLSTTYVTFMVAMGSSFADRAWGPESAVFRITGVLTVVGGWFMTALMAFTIASVFAAVIHLSGTFGVFTLIALTLYIYYQSHQTHLQRQKETEDVTVFNLKKITDAPTAIDTTFTHMSIYLREIRYSIDAAMDGIFTQNLTMLRNERKKIKKIQQWSNIIIANIFKVMRLLEKTDVSVSIKYSQTIRRLQKLADGHRDLVLRSYVHVSNQHTGLLDVQIVELREVKKRLIGILGEVEITCNRKKPADTHSVMEMDARLREFADEISKKQNNRIRDRSSKTRLSIIYYAIVGNSLMISKQTLKLLQIFQESFCHDEEEAD